MGRLGLEDQRDRPVVDQIDLHVSAKSAASSLRRSAEPLIQGLGNFRCCRREKARGGSLCRFRRYRVNWLTQRISRSPSGSFIRPSLILEDPQSHRLAGEPLDLFGSVPRCDAKQNEQSGTDRPDRVPVDLDSGPGNALDHGAQRRA